MELNMKKTNGFTLIELLVVIAIIALLLSIIMPSLRLAKSQAQKTLCQSNLRQWGIIWQMYLEANNASFPQLATPANGDGHWMAALRNYYDDPKIRCCSAANNPGKQRELTYRTWGPWPEDYAWQQKGDYGSYGINSWIYNIPEGISDYGGTGPTRFNWRKKTSVKVPSTVPLMADSLWVDSWPMHVNLPPVRQGENDVNIMMQRYCLNRHSGYVGAVFMDSSASMVGLKSLWSLKWHKEYDTSYTDRSDYPWPEWMESFK
jgi:prepilin-type N-terminal cleavage/methylation domain-containing protein